MNKIVLLFKTYLLPLGAVGIFSMTFLDSTFVPMPQFMDLTFIGFCLARRSMIPIYCLAATLGSVAGCFLLFSFSRRGSKFVRSRLGRSRKVFDAIGRHGATALLVASLMPPPFPFKLFIIAAGMFPISPIRLILALALGRGFRFVFEGTLAYLYGDLVIEYMRKDFARMSLILAGIILLVTIASYLAKRRFLREEAAGESGSQR
ncbi:MAG: hypothetical protein AB1714_19800 [Acidobacteriota bacterium]